MLQSSSGSRKSRAAYCFSFSYVSLINLKGAEGLGVLIAGKNKSLNNFYYDVYCFALRKWKKTQTNNGKWAPDAQIPITSDISFFGSLEMWVQMKGTLHYEFIFWGCF